MVTAAPPQRVQLSDLEVITASHQRSDCTTKVIASVLLFRPARQCRDWIVGGGYRSVHQVFTVGRLSKRCRMLETGNYADQPAQLTNGMHVPYPVAVYGSAGALIVGTLVYFVGRAWIDRRVKEPQRHYRDRKFFGTIITLSVVGIIVVLWSRSLQHTGTFLGLLGAGLAIALREPLLSIAGRIAVFAGNMYTVGDRIQVEQMTGDVIDVGAFYTRMMEIGNWIGGDQATGRILQLPNSQVFGTAIFNYTQNFSYIWDEVKLPITYQSNLDQATRILLDIGGEYSNEYLQGAEEQVQKMKEYFVVADIDLRPRVYVKVTSNWVELSMRYLVQPMKRRTASSFIYTELFKRVQASNNISIASETMDLTVHPPKAA
jgi:small-conductance mechanosensitive channel